MRMTKGEKTKKKIEEAAKVLFRQKGYKRTLVKDIIGSVGIAPGNLTYYFPTKDTIAVELISAYIERIDSFISSTFPGITPSRGAAYLMAIFYTNIFSDEGTKQFFGEVIKRKNVHYMLHDKQRNFYEAIGEDRGASVSSTDFEVFKCGNVGSRFELLNAYYDGRFPDLKDEKLIRTMYIITVMLLTGSNEKTDEVLSDAYKDLAKVDTSSLQLLR